MEARAKSEKWMDNEGWLFFWTTIGLDDPFHDVRTIQNLLLQEKAEVVPETESAESPNYEAKREKLFGEGKRISSWLTLSTILGLDDPFRHVSRGLQNFLLQKKTEEVSQTESAVPLDHEAKGEKLSGGEERISSWKVAVKVFRVPVIASLIFLMGVTWWIFSGSFQEGIREEGSQTQAIGAGNYQKFGIVTMTKVEPNRGKGLVEIPLDLVKEKKLVSFEYETNEGQVPLLAYVTPTGKVVTMVGISEPCHSKNFHLEGNEIVCDVCATRWKLETLAGSEGECAANPLEMLPHTVQGGKVIIKEMDLQNWEPKVVRG